MRPPPTILAIGLASLGLVAACEQDPRGIDDPPVPRSRVSAPAVVPTVPPAPGPRPAPTLTPVPNVRSTPRPALATRRPVPDPAPDVASPPTTPPTRPPSRDRAGPLPQPPSLDPEAYATWLRGQPRATRQRISKFCASNRQRFEATCGGIGPLHIPYPPYARLPSPRGGPASTGPHSLFSSVADWRASLSSRQLAYLGRECPGGEDQPSSDLCGENTPLVVAFDGQPVEFVRGGAFAFQPGPPTATDWPTATTPWIALDRDGNGTIDGGGELFGSDTVTAGGETAANGFVALAELDANHDGRIDAADPAFGAIVLWADHDHDQRSSPAELTPLATVIVSISLAHRVELRCDLRGNCEGERAALTWRDANGATRAGTVIDVYLPRR